MAFRRRRSSFGRKKRSFRRRYVRRARRSYRRRSIPSMISNTYGGFPVSKVAKLRYSDVVTINPTASGVAMFHAFRANSIYDPDSTGVGHQPMGRDIWAQVYNHYTVIGSKITATMVPSGTSNYQATFGITIDDNATPADQTINTLIERGNSVYKQFLNSYQYNSQSVSVLRKGFSARKFFHIKNIRDNILTYGAEQGSNPTDQAYFLVWVGSNSADIDLVSVQVTIEYLVLFTEPADISAS